MAVACLYQNKMYENLELYLDLEIVVYYGH